MCNENLKLVRPVVLDGQLQIASVATALVCGETIRAINTVHHSILFLVSSPDKPAVNFVAATAGLCADQGFALQQQFERFASDPQAYGGSYNVAVIICIFHLLLQGMKRNCAAARVALKQHFHGLVVWLLALRLEAHVHRFDYGIACIFDYIDATWSGEKLGGACEELKECIGQLNKARASWTRAYMRRVGCLRLFNSTCESDNSTVKDKRTSTLSKASSATDVARRSETVDAKRERSERLRQHDVESRMATLATASTSDATRKLIWSVLSGKPAHLLDAESHKRVTVAVSYVGGGVFEVVDSDASGLDPCLLAQDQSMDNLRAAAGLRGASACSA